MREGTKFPSTTLQPLANLGCGRLPAPTKGRYIYMNINLKKVWATAFSDIKKNLFNIHDDNSYFAGLSKAIRTVNPNESESDDKCNSNAK